MRRGPKILRTSWPNQPNAYGTNWERLSDECRRRAGYRCEQCGWAPPRKWLRGQLHAHHIIPLSKGGINALANLKCLCKRCHQEEHPHMQRQQRKFRVRGR